LFWRAVIAQYYCAEPPCKFPLVCGGKVCFFFDKVRDADPIVEIESRGLARYIGNAGVYRDGAAAQSAD